LPEENFSRIICQLTGAQAIVSSEVLQQLWSGYGTIERLYLTGGSVPSVIVKTVDYGRCLDHPVGWQDDYAHQRKIKSYEVEVAWYSHWSEHCQSMCRVPQCFYAKTFEQKVIIALEDMDVAGFSKRKTSVTVDEIKSCLKWLAYFHATFMGYKPSGLWSIGTYWHLDTRPNEWEAMAEGSLKSKAVQIDQKLRALEYQTIVHGDAKIANFCFSEGVGPVAAVDFQYVGKGCGIKDVIYLMSSCLEADGCVQYEKMLLDYYFSELAQAITAGPLTVNFIALEKEWRFAYAYAWADFYRFLQGWNPKHWKINSYCERLTKEVVEQLSG